MRRWPPAVVSVWLALLLQPSSGTEVRSGSRISLQAHTGAFIDVDESVVEARWTTHRSSQDLVLERLEGGVIHSGDMVSLRTPGGRYLEVVGEGIKASWAHEGVSQKFVIEMAVRKGAIMNGDKVFFRAHTGMYVDVDGYKVRARWPDQGRWQRFAIHDQQEEGGTFDLFHSALDTIGAGCGFVTMKGAAIHQVCDQFNETDCTSRTQLAKACPPMCPFVVPHPQLSCVFRCTAAEECSKANPETPYANDITKVCEPCDVVGCRRCTSPQVCAECFDNFLLEFGGHACVYVWDARAQHGVHAAAALVMALTLVASVVLVIADHCACCGHCLPKELPDESEAFEESDDDIPTMEMLPPILEESAISKAIREGKRHRGRCKIKDFDVFRLGHDVEMKPQMSSMTQENIERLPIWMNFRAKFLTGVGLPLFHQWYRFLFLYSVLLAAGTFWVYRYSELGGVLQKTGIGHAMSNGLSTGQEADTMSECGLRQRNSDQLNDSVRDFAMRAAIVYFVLWMVGFVLSIAHAARQKMLAADFYSEHPCLAEFALNVEGFPPDATDEERIRSYLRDSFGISNLEVSVCYDYRRRWDRVHDLLEKVLVNADVKAGTYDISMSANSRGRKTVGLTSEERREVRSWFDAPGGITNSGQVFAIFKNIYDMQRCRRKFESEIRSPYPPAAPILPSDDTPRWLPHNARPLIWVDSQGKMHDLRIRDVVCEPPDVIWENLGTPCCRLVLGHIFAGFAILASFATLAQCIFVPLAKYSIEYMWQAGSLPTGVMMSVLGTLVMAANWVMCFVHSSASALVGFVRRDREGLLLFKVFAFLCLINFIFNVSIALFPESQAQAWDYIFHPLGRGLVTMQGIAFQARVSGHIFHVLVPGGLFIGYLIWPLQGFLWPFASNLAWLRCRYRRSRFVPARAAELALEPLVISIPHDYMGHIVQPTACTLVLFFASDVAWQTFACLTCWTLFMIPFMRYLHTRQVRRFYLTTNRLDADALFIWSFPLSLVLAASFFWAAQLRGWPLYLVFPVWACGIALYVIVLAHGVRPLVSPKSVGNCLRPSYDDVRAMRRYDWHNCNPIKVLLSHCGTGEGSIVPFAVGKEYLQDMSDQQKEAKRSRKQGYHKSNRSNHDATKSDDGNSASIITNDTWRHIPTFPEVETLINGPLDAWSALEARVQRARADTADRLSQSPEFLAKQDSWPESCEGIQFAFVPKGDGFVQPL